MTLYAYYLGNGWNENRIVIWVNLSGCTQIVQGLIVICYLFVYIIKQGNKKAPVPESPQTPELPSQNTQSRYEETSSINITLSYGLSNFQGRVWECPGP